MALWQLHPRCLPGCLRTMLECIDSAPLLVSPLFVLAPRGEGILDLQVLGSAALQASIPVFILFSLLLGLFFFLILGFCLVCGFVVLSCFVDRVLLYSPGWPETCCIDKAVSAS